MSNVMEARLFACLLITVIMGVVFYFIFSLKSVFIHPHADYAKNAIMMQKIHSHVLFPKAKLKNLGGSNIRGDEALLRAAQDIFGEKGIVLVNMINNAYVELTKSWICNLRHYPDALRHIVLIATDMKAYNSLKQFTDEMNVVYYGISAPENALSYGEKQYFSYGYERLKIQNYLIQNDITTMIVESDAVWNHDGVIQYMKEQIENHDIVALNDGGDKITLGAGWFLTRSTPTVRTLFQEYVIRY